MQLNSKYINKGMKYASWHKRLQAVQYNHRVWKRSSKLNQIRNLSIIDQEQFNIVTELLHIIMAQLWNNCSSRLPGSPTESWQLLGPVCM